MPSFKRAEQTHAIELDTLQQLATQSISAQRIEPLYDRMLETILTLLHADLASIQSFYPKRGSTGELKLLGHRGFSADNAKRWEWVTPATRTICGEALRTGRGVAIEDIRKSNSMAGSDDLEALLAAGVRSAQSFPLRSRSGDLLGMVSVYWREIHDMSRVESRAWEILTRLAADIMERSAADENLRSALQELQLIMENMAAVVSRCSRDLRYLWVSHSYAAWLGKPGPEAITGRYMPDVLGREGFESIRPHVEKVLAGDREEFETQVTYVGPGRRWIHAVYVPTRDHENSVDGWIAVVRDITEQHEAEERLRHSEERFRRVADSAPVIIWVCGPDKLGTFVNKGWLNFTGRTMEDELGYGWTERIHPEDFEASVAAFTSSYDTRCRYQIEYRARRADGAYRSILDCGDPLFGPGGEFQGYIGSCVDITDLKLAQNALLGRQKLESIGLLAAGIAHDFGNLLAGIISSADLALSEVADGSAAAEGVRNIQTVACRASEIVRQLLVYSGHETASHETLHLSCLIEEMAELLKISIPKRVTVRVECEKELPSIMGSASQVRQVIMNLIINAAEAIGEHNGTITVTASRVTGGKELAPGSAMELSLGDYVRLEVSDTGCGMSEPQRMRVFDPFFTTKATGRGLGLAVVQGIVCGHNGAISVLSGPGEGTTFQIFLPVGVGAATNV